MSCSSPRPLPLLPALLLQLMEACPGGGLAGLQQQGGCLGQMLLLSLNLSLLLQLG
jgi:hypothetical protein